jgi:hypothetical protein
MEDDAGFGLADDEVWKAPSSAPAPPVVSIVMREPGAIVILALRR